MATNVSGAVILRPSAFHSSSSLRTPVPFLLLSGDAVFLHFKHLELEPPNETAGLPVPRLAIL